MPVRPWEKCKDHGPAQPRVWACPACLVELRKENERLRARVLELEAVHEDASGAVLAERERCASLAENWPTPDCGGWTLEGLCEAIRKA